MGVYDVVQARLWFGEASSATCPEEIATEAKTELARILWHVDGDAPGAARLLGATPAGMTPVSCAGLRLRLRIESEQEGRGYVTAPDALRACDGIEPLVRVESLRARLSAKEQDDVSVADLRELLAGLDAAPSLARASLEASRLRLRLGLLLQDPTVAEEGLTQFYWLDDLLLLPAARGQSVRELLAAALAREASPRDRGRLAEMLVRAGFHEEVPLLRRPTDDANDPVWRSTDAYLAMRRRLTTRLLDHDRARALGLASEGGALVPQIDAILVEGVRAAGGDADHVWDALHTLWGLVGITGRSNGVEGLHLGHVSVAEARSVVQGARSGEVRFIALDNMIANGFSGWLGDGVSGPAGWAADERIIQVRPRYIQVALDRAALAGPSPRREQFIDRMRARSDQEASAGDPGIAYLPGLSDRLQLQAVDGLVVELRGSGAAEDIEMELARLWYARSFEGAILLHEGRHILDQKSFVGAAALTDAELEYRAKLSELGLSQSPRVILSTVYGRLIGGQTGHGIANARLVADYTAWMEMNSAEIEGYDDALPALLQLDRLSDAQIASIARGLDVKSPDR